MIDGIAATTGGMIAAIGDGTAGMTGTGDTDITEPRSRKVIETDSIEARGMQELIGSPTRITPAITVVATASIVMDSVEDMSRDSVSTRGIGGGGNRLVSLLDLNRGKKPLASERL